MRKIEIIIFRLYIVIGIFFNKVILIIELKITGSKKIYKR